MSAESIRALKEAAREEKDNPKPKKWYRMPFQTKKQRKTMKKLSVEYGPYLEENPVCMIQSPDCTGHATCVHHTKGRGKKIVMDPRFWKPSCDPCNYYVEKHDAWARENGHKVSRLAKDPE